MSLDVYLQEVQVVKVHRGNITHNLGGMAQRAGVYMCIWRPDEIGITTAGQLIDPITDGIKWLEDNATEALTYQPANGWGSYDGLLKFLRNYKAACQEHPEALVEVCR